MRKILRKRQSGNPVSKLKIKTGDPIEIIWDDAFEMHEKSWFELNEVQPSPDYSTVKTIGYFLRCEHNRCLVYGDDGGSEISRILAIPMCCIRKFRKLK